MSGIAGIVCTDNRPVEYSALERMLNALAHRGPDGSGLWMEGSAGLVNRMFHDTPESLHEQQPCVDRASGIVLTADARIDNRSQLMRDLGLGGEDPLLLPDSRLILLAYERWGEDCVTRIHGDFAFALWDSRRRCLFCGRDYIGVKPFYYAHCGNLFAFASEIRGLLCLGDIPSDLNEEMIARYLELNLDDKEMTFYKKIFRLPPAHVMRVDQDGLHMHCYWRPDPSHELRLKSNREYAEAFREVFTEAVRCRLRSAFPVGAMLSGGMDSSSITCLARDLLAQEGNGRKLRTFSAVFDKLPQVDEKSYIDTVIASGGIEPHFVPMDDLGPFETYLDGQRHEEYPYAGMTYYLHFGLHRKMREQGIRVVLDGHGGDDNVNHGTYYLAELARNLRILRLFQEASAFSRLRGIPLTRILWRLGFRPNMPDFLLSLWHRVRYQRALKPFPCRDLPMADNLLNHLSSLNQTHREEIAVAGKPRTLREEHATAFTSGMEAFTFEVNDKLSYGHSLVTRYPFFDRRLAELCLSLPPDQKLSRGWTRMILRRAMEGILPSEIQWRLGKSSLAPHFVNKMLETDGQMVRNIIDSSSETMKDYVDIERLRDCCAGLLSGRAGVDRYWRAVWPGATLGAWMLQLAQLKQMN